MGYAASNFMKFWFSRNPPSKNTFFWGGYSSSRPRHLPGNFKSFPKNWFRASGMPWGSVFVHFWVLCKNPKVLLWLWQIPAKPAPQIRRSLNFWHSWISDVRFWSFGKVAKMTPNVWKSRQNYAFFIINTKTAEYRAPGHPRSSRSILWKALEIS